MKNWNSAIAVVMDDDPDVEKIHINSKTNLGRSFDLDEVVVKKVGHGIIFCQHFK